MHVSRDVDFHPCQLLYVQDDLVSRIWRWSNWESQLRIKWGWSPRNALRLNDVSAWVLMWDIRRNKNQPSKAGEKLFSALDTTFVFYNHPHSGILRIHGIFPQGKMAAKIGGTSIPGSESHLGSSSMTFAGALSIAIRTCTPSLLYFGSFLES